MGSVDRAEPRGVLIGLEAGQRSDPTGICVATAEERRSGAGRAEIHFTVRLLERLKAGTTYLRQAKRLGSIVGSLRDQRHSDRPIIYANATGKGESLVELLVAHSDVQVQSVYFNHGDRRQQDGDVITLGKARLVFRLQVLLQTGQLHLPRTAGADQLAEELLDYEITTTEDANDRYGAFRVGQQDELVTALGLAVQVDPPRPGTFRPGFY